MFSSASVAVVVLMPPPVELGDAPIHIKTIVKKVLPLKTMQYPNVLKPAVRETAE